MGRAPGRPARPVLVPASHHQARKAGLETSRGITLRPGSKKPAGSERGVSGKPIFVLSMPHPQVLYWQPSACISATTVPLKGWVGPGAENLSLLFRELYGSGCFSGLFLGPFFRAVAQGWFNRNSISAFCACRRFPAWSQTMLCGPSMTLAATSSPRWAGRQCMNTASSAACDISSSLTV